VHHSAPCASEGRIKSWQKDGRTSVSDCHLVEGGVARRRPLITSTVDGMSMDVAECAVRGVVTAIQKAKRLPQRSRCRRGATRCRPGGRTTVVCSQLGLVEPGQPAGASGSASSGPMTGGYVEVDGRWMLDAERERAHTEPVVRTQTVAWR
jgi:hypothetical protein